MTKNCFAKNLKRIRQEKGYTQTAFATVCGLKRNTVACYESGKGFCDFDTLLLFSEILDCSVDELLKEPAPISVRKNPEANKSGVIYILTNPSFPDYVKIGYADDIDKRLQQLNQSECIPFSFRVYATYSVTSRLSDLKLHTIIDRLNPNLRAVEMVRGQRRIREFYALPAEDAYLLLEAIAEMHNRTDKLKRTAPELCGTEEALYNL